MRLSLQPSRIVSLRDGCNDRRILGIINQQYILSQRRRNKVYLPSIPFLPPLSRDIMYRITPNLFRRPLVLPLFFVGDSIRPKHALILECSGCPSFFEKGVCDVG